MHTTTPPYSPSPEAEPSMKQTLSRAKLGIKWEADRGKDVPSAPWYKLLTATKATQTHKNQYGQPRLILNFSDSPVAVFGAGGFSLTLSRNTVSRADRLCQALISPGSRNIQYPELNQTNALTGRHIITIKPLMPLLYNFLTLSRILRKNSGSFWCCARTQSANFALYCTGEPLISPW